MSKSKVDNLRVGEGIEFATNAARAAALAALLPSAAGRAVGDVLTIAALSPLAFAWSTPGGTSGGGGGGTPALLTGTWSSSFVGYSGFELPKIYDGSLTTSFISQCPDTSEDAAVVTFDTPKRITSFKVCPHNGSEARSAGLKMQASTVADPGVWITLATFGTTPAAGYTDFPVSDATLYKRARVLNQTGVSGGSSPLSVGEMQVFGY